MLNIAFIGCGGIARHHAVRLSQLSSPGVRLTATADPDTDAATAFARDFGRDGDVAVHADYRDLLQREDVDAVFVCTPTYLHAAPVIAAARAGKHVFCEKPMAMKLGDAHRMAEACERHGVRLTIGFVRRFDSFWGCMGKIVASGMLGAPLVWLSASSGHQGRAWMRDADKGGGPLMDGAVHNYDFALQMFGPAETVQASSLRFDATSVGADTASAIITFASGDQLSMSWSWGMPAGVNSSSINEIIGPRGALPIRAGTPAETPRSFDPERQAALVVSAKGGTERVRAYRRQDMFAEQLKHVCRHFARGTQPRVTADDGIKSLEVAVAVLKSGRSRRAVRL